MRTIKEIESDIAFVREDYDHEGLVSNTFGEALKDDSTTD